MVEMLRTPHGRRIAHVRTDGQGPGIVFLTGFRSDMTGDKALALEAWARGQGRAFTRFDYSGHGVSGGRFEDGAIGDWLADASAVLDLAPGPQVLVGSSMGGWIALLLARDRPERVRGLVTIAAAPEFPEAMHAAMDAGQQAELAARGVVALPSDYGEPYAVTRRLVEAAAAHRVFDRRLPVGCPWRMLQGTDDRAVPVATALRLLDHAEGPDIRLTLVKGADHRFSTPVCLRLIEAAVADVS